jgi:maltooligosyltrehalose trehalohydrolase
MRNWRFGPALDASGATFRVWAPDQAEISLVIEGEPERLMVRDAEGLHDLHVPGARAGHRYWLRLPGGLRPDPASRFQPAGPLGPSELIDNSFAWTDQDWSGIPKPHRQVIYELHLGTFTREGTWDAATLRLPALVEVGITTIEIMPVAEFAGSFGWGYDGVRLYGRPDAVRRFVNEAHRLGLAVILDVVYNHFGPVGNYLSEFSAAYVGKPGEWGDLVNYDGPGSGEVRRFTIENAAYWVREFHFDGLRFDATQAIEDASPTHILHEICAAAREAAGTRAIFLVGESEPQETRLLKINDAARDGLDALWSEDWHHAAFVRATGRRNAYFTDYLGTAPEFASMARHGTLYQGQWYSWQQQRRGGRAIGLPASAFVAFLENHDQIANTGLGLRLHEHVDPALWRALTALLLLSPSVPLLFQGQEFGSTRPFTYFADHDGELADAVEAGRRQFMMQFSGPAQPAMQERLPCPHDARTFEQCKLLDDERDADSPLRRLHRDLIHLRRTDRVLADVGTAAVGIESSAPHHSVVVIRYLAASSHRLVIVNLADDHESPMNEPLFAPPGGDWRMVWSSEDPAYDGSGATPLVPDGRWLLQARSATLLAAEVSV